MLKLYRARDTSVGETAGPAVKPLNLILVPDSCTDGEDDGLVLRNADQKVPRLPNSELLKTLDSHLSYLGEKEREDISNLIRESPGLFSDVPTRTTVLEHDIDVGIAKPIRQHPYRVNAVKRSRMKQEVTY